MALQLFVGQSSLRGAIGKYASHFNLLELRADQERLPRDTVLRRWAEEVPERFVFSVLITPQHLRESSGTKALVTRVTSAAQCLAARWVVVQTDPMWGPSQRTKQRLQELFAPLLDTSCRVAWEPHGVWQDDEALAYARELGVHYVRDIGRGDPLGEEIIYSRMPGIGVAARMSIGALERAAANIGSASEVFLVVGGDGARKLQQLLPDLLQSQALGMARNLNADSAIETFGGFTSQSTPEDEDQMFDDFEDDEVEEVEGAVDESEEDDESEESEEDDESEELDEDLDEELDEESEPLDEDSDRSSGGGASARPATSSKWVHDKKKKETPSKKPRKESGRR